MDTLEGLRRRLESAQDLRSVVKTMKALAAVSIHHYHEAVESLADYHRTIELGLQAALRNHPAPLAAAQPVGRSRMGAIIVGSDQGMCGQFNEQIAGYAVARMDGEGLEPHARAVLAVGVRVVYPLETHDQPVEEVLALPASLGGATEMVQRLILRVEQWTRERAIGRFVLYYNTPTSSSTYTSRATQLLPIDPEWVASLRDADWPGASLPAFTVGREELLSALIRQYLLVSVYRAVIESLTAESISRMQSMQAAEKNIEERLADLTARFHHQRQTSITMELMDIIGGFEALTGAES